MNILITLRVRRIKKKSRSVVSASSDEIYGNNIARERESENTVRRARIKKRKCVLVREYLSGEIGSEVERARTARSIARGCIRSFAAGPKVRWLVVVVVLSSREEVHAKFCPGKSCDKIINLSFAVAYMKADVDQN